MAPSLATINGVPLLLLSILVPVRFLDLFIIRSIFPLPSRSGHRHKTPMRSLLVLWFATALVIAIHAFSDPIAAADRGAESVSKVEEMRREMEVEIQALKDHVVQLECSLVESTKKLDVKSELLEENSKLIAAMERDIQYLIDEQQNIKISRFLNGQLLQKSSLSTSYDQEDSKDMEQEVELLKDHSRNVNSNINNLELSAKDTEKKLESLNSEIVKFQSIVSEQWIQIRQLEQAFLQTAIMASRVQRQTKQNASLGKRSYLKVVQLVEVIRLQLIRDLSMLESFVLGPMGSYLSDASENLLRFGTLAQTRFQEVLLLTRRIRLRLVSDETMLDSFFMGCSVSRPCLPHIYNHFEAIKSVAQKCLLKVAPSLPHIYDHFEAIKSVAQKCLLKLAPSFDIFIVSQKY